MAKVFGDNAVLFFYDSGSWKLYACDRSITLDVTTEVIETSVSGSGNWATFLPTKNSWTGSMDGVVSLNEINKLSLPDLRQRQYAGTLLLLRFQHTATDGTVYTEQGTAIITDSNDIGAYNSVNIFTIQLKGTGPLTQIFTPVTVINPGKVKRYPTVGSTAPATGGETSFVIASLIGKDILSVTKDGVGNNDIILSGTPVAKEVKYETTTGTFTWAIPFEAGENYFILYQDL